MIFLLKLKLAAENKVMHFIKLKHLTKKHWSRVSLIYEEIAGFIVLSKTSNRNVYRGVAEVSLYVSKTYRRQKVGKTLLNEIIKESEKEGFWTLQASIFSQNKASIDLFKKCDFRIVGFREKIGQLNLKWYDNYLMEKRSKLV